MTFSLQVKKGLHFSLASFPSIKTNSSYLKNTINGVSMLIQFTPSDILNGNDSNALSYEINFNFHHGYLKEFTTEAENNLQQFSNDMQHDLCPNTQMILHEIINCKLQHSFRNMFLESKALALLLCFQKCKSTNENDCASCKFLTKPIEKVKIQKARELILNRLSSPPTIQELSVQIGINQCYLKQGFKEMFGVTVYEFIQEQRMLKAKMLLSSNEYSVAQVADEIGFSSKSNFSTAFKKYTGIFPSELQHN